MVFSFRLRLLLDVLLFINDNNECYFTAMDISLITMRLDDAVMECNEDIKSTNQFLLDQVSNIRKGIIELLSNSLKR